MAHFTVDFFSQALGKHTSVSVILPERREVPENGWRTIYLLHGWSENHTAWTRFTSIERYAEKRGIAVIMPDGAFSFYTDMANGEKYRTYITEELPKLMGRWFRISGKREDNFIGGLSMGGCGALDLGLRRNDLYSGIIVLSATNFPCDLMQMQYEKHQYGPEWLRQMRNCYGESFPEGMPGSEFDIRVMVKRILENGGPYPVLYQYMGEEETDGLYYARIMEKDFLSIPGDPFKYHLAVYHGVHNWDAWDAHICEGLDHIGLTEVK